jgi:hypothetical protein
LSSHTLHHLKCLPCSGYGRRFLDRFVDQELRDGLTGLAHLFVEVRFDALKVIEDVRESLDSYGNTDALFVASTTGCSV